ncbi:Os02g0201800 [Oryza sativa Japonica Group]|uniref:Os02g0201800 protein n=1 Tax=Oryza sativa subsp. japonica TaxID=39947 RepID=A0A0N7KEW1_ORYSJ|nr:hypothetical protein EE612_009578 [Oryza sativa]BAS77521.1 Os02g0201800 [Oryza sativa Japonica Group]
MFGTVRIDPSMPNYVLISNIMQIKSEFALHFGHVLNYVSCPWLIRKFTNITRIHNFLSGQETVKVNYSISLPSSKHC